MKTEKCRVLGIAPEVVIPDSKFQEPKFSIVVSKNRKDKQERQKQKRKQNRQGKVAKYFRSGKVCEICDQLVSSIDEKTYANPTKKVARRRISNFSTSL